MASQLRKYNKKVFKKHYGIVTLYSQYDIILERAHYTSHTQLAALMEKFKQLHKNRKGLYFLCSPKIDEAEIQELKVFKNTG